MVATPSDTETERKGVTSITIPSLEDRPAKKCPRDVVSAPAQHDGLRAHAVELCDERLPHRVVVRRPGEHDVARDPLLQPQSGSTVMRIDAGGACRTSRRRCGSRSR